MKLHINDDQLDGKMTPRCGRGRPFWTLPEEKFAAADPAGRCKLCERWWFPNGQPDWHLAQAQKRRAESGEIL